MTEDVREAGIFSNEKRKVKKEKLQR